MYDAAPYPYLYVNVGAFVSRNSRNGPFVVEVSFIKILFDAVADTTVMAKTWFVTDYGMHGGDSGAILERVSTLLDRFLLEYVRANEDACEQ